MTSRQGRKNRVKQRLLVSCMGCGLVHVERFRADAEPGAGWCEYCPDCVVLINKRIATAHTTRNRGLRRGRHGENRERGSYTKHAHRAVNALGQDLG